MNNNAPLAQLVEHRTFNPLVAGSTPAGRTTGGDIFTQKKGERLIRKR